MSEKKNIGTLLSLLESHMTRKDSDTAFSFFDGENPLWLHKTLSYGELRRYSGKFAWALRNHVGMVSGERIILMLPNVIQFPVVYFGALRAGMIVVPINPLFKKQELLKIIKDSKAKCIVVLEELYSSVAGAVEESGIPNVVLTSVADTLPWPKSYFYNRRNFQARNHKKIIKKNFTEFHLRKLMKFSHDADLTDNVSPKNIAAIIYTSGTTSGEPKGVVMTHEALYANAVSCQHLMIYDLGMPKKAKMLAAAPFFHIMGLAVMMHAAMLMDAEVVLVSDRDFLTLARKMLSAISYKKIFGFVGAPRHYQFLASVLKNNATKYDLASLELCVTGSAHMPDDARKKFESFWDPDGKKKVLEGFGMTEGGILACQRPWNAKPGSIGRVLPGISFEICNPDENGFGELVVKSPGTMLGYWNTAVGVDLEKTSAVVNKNGKLFTGDLARADENGEIFLGGRIKDIVKGPNGENIDSLEVENELMKFPGVLEAAVIGVIHPKHGEIPVAFLVVENISAGENKELAQKIVIFCRERLSDFKIPREIEFLPELPKNENGKVLKRKLKGA